MTQITPAQLRANFPEFISATLYPDSGFSFWIDVGYKMLSACRWGDQLDLGVQLFAMHNAVLERWDSKTASFGGAPGGRIGAVSNKSVDKVSVGYDVASAIEPDAGHWNMTVYGLRYQRLVSLFGAGPVQVNGVYGYDYGYRP